MAFTLLLTTDQQGGFHLAGSQTSANLGSGGVVVVSTDDNALLTVFHPPPPGPDKQISFKTGDSVTVFTNGDILIRSTVDPSPLRCTEKDWPAGWNQTGETYKAYHSRR